MKITIFLLIYFFHLNEGGFIQGKGRNCGTLEPIVKLQKMPESQDDIDELACAVIEDEESFQAYLKSQPGNNQLK